MISRVINCEAANIDTSTAGIAHSIYNRMTSGVSEWTNGTALSIIQNTGIDCYTNNRYQNYPASTSSDQAAQWLLGIGTAPNVDPLIDLRAYYWLGVETFSRIGDEQQRREAIFAEILDNPSLYNYGACGANETREVRLQRLRNRFVAIDTSSGQLTTIYFSQHPLCEQ